MKETETTAADTLTVEALCEDRVFCHFHEIAQIPHGSGNEKQISDFLLNWAREQGLAAEQDEVNNVLVEKPASPGYEEHPPVMLQAHIDMVCEKREGSPHDFTKDPIPWVIEGEWLTTGGETTLGGDDGAGVALAMTVLEDRNLAHPPLQVLFTVNEEDDFTGAMNFDIAKMKGDTLINLDNDEEDVIICGSSGGMQVDFELPVSFVGVPEGWEAYRLSVSGLKGGHSGEDIHRGRGSANSFLTRLLLAAEETCGCLLAGIQGGTFRLAISREAEAVLWLEPSGLPALQARVAELTEDFRAELAVTAESVQVSLTPAQADPVGTAPGPVLSALTLLPDGIFQMNEALTGLVDTSDNLGEIYLTQEGLHVVLELRSVRNSLREYLYQKVERVAKLLGGTSKASNPYPSWYFTSRSPLRQLYMDTYRSLFNREPVSRTIHAGLEVGCFFEKRADIDAIAVGPDCYDFHSPAERLRIPSMKRVYRCLCEVLAAL